MQRYPGNHSRWLKLNRFSFTVIALLIHATSTAGELGDFVFNDIDRNGIFDANENGLSGVRFELSSCSGNFIGATTSTSDGSYLFTDLPSGDYILRVVPPSGYSISPPGRGHWSMNSDFNPVSGLSGCRSLTSSQNRDAIDAGLFVTTNKGSGYLGDRVWQDADGDGEMDASESGMPGVVMNLSSCDGSPISSVTTGSDGAYGFENLPAGNYLISINVPVGFGLSPPGAAHWSVDSDFNAAANSYCRTLADGQSRDGIDAGLVPDGSNPGGTGTIGNFAWHDVNNNGQQDGGEPGLAGIEFELQMCNGQRIATATTDNSGTYVFSNLMEGDYQVSVSPPDGQSLTDFSVGDYSTDNDFDPATQLTSCRFLADGQARLGVDAGFADSGGNGDNVGNVICPGGGSAYIGDWVWEDTNGDGIQNRAVEPGIGDIAVNLHECTGSPEIGCQCDSEPFCTSVSDADGTFSFGGLLAGAYQLRITVAGSPYRTGPTHVVSYDIDNDFGNHFNDGDAVGYCKVMATGQRRPGADAGLVPRN